MGCGHSSSLSLAQYHKTLESYAVLDFSGVLERAVDLLKQMEEFSQSRYKLEARYQHVLVDEFQDTNRAQWELVSLLVRSWGEGFGVAEGRWLRRSSSSAIASSLFTDSATPKWPCSTTLAGFVAALRPDSQPRQAIATSFRAVPELLAFVNESVCRDREDHRRSSDAMHSGTARRIDFLLRSVRLRRTDEAVTFLGVADSRGGGRTESPTKSPGSCRRAPSSEIRRRASPAPLSPADIAVLFRSRDSHREYEAAIDRRGIPTYVYKGLGFFDADEIQDAIALLRFLARPTSDLRAVSLLRSRIVRLSDPGLVVARAGVRGRLGERHAAARVRSAWRGRS